MLDKVLEDIRNEEMHLNGEYNKPDKELLFLDKVLLENNFQSFLDVLNINLCDILIAYIVSANNTIPFSIIKNLYNNYKKEINTGKYISLFVLTETIKDLLENYTYDEITNAMQDNNNIENLQEKINKLKNYDDKAYPNMRAMLDIYYSNPNAIEIGYNMLVIIRNISDEYKEYMESEYAYKKKKFNLKDKEMKNEIKQHMKTFYNKKEFQNFIKNITTTIHNNYESKKNLKKKIKKELNYYSEIKKWLSSSENEVEITNIPIEISKIKNKKIAINILQEVNKNNQLYYEEVNNEYNNSQKNSYAMFKKIFKSYNINIDEYNINFNESIDIMKEKLSHLKNIGINNKNKIVNIINNVNLEDIIYINSLCSSGYLTTEFIEKNDIFANNLNILKTNLNLLKENNISSTVILKMNDILLTNCKLLNENFIILKSYNLIKKLKSTTDFSFLKSTDLTQKIDKNLELNLEKFLKDDIDILNKDIKTLDRILIVRNLNLEIKNKNELNYYLETNNFYINDAIIDKYIEDITPLIKLEDEESSRMEKFEFLTLLEEKNNKENKRTYIFNGIPISKNKVKRNLEKIENNTLTRKDQFNCLISNLKLNENDFNNLYNCLYEKEYQYKI